VKSVQKPENPVLAWIRDADQYCFGFGSATTLGIFRILFGFWVMMNYLILLPFWEVWFSERGYMPGWLARLWFRHRSEVPSGLIHFFPDGIPRLDLLNGVTDPRIGYAFFLAVIVLAGLTCIGLATRFSAFFLFLGVITLHHRDGAILHGGDTLMRVMVVYMAVSPCGRACSVDRLIGLWKGTVSHEPPQVSLWSQRLIAFNVSLIYFTSVWFKWDGDKWRTLIATYYPERLAEFFRFPLPEFFRSVWMARVTTFGTLMTEFLMGTLVFFPPARKYVLLAGVMMHSYIEYSMNIPLFSFMMISSYITFFQGEEITAWALRVGSRLRRFHVEVRLPLGQKLSPRGVAFFSALDPFGFVSFLPGDGAETTAMRFDKTEANLNRILCARLMGGWGFLWIPGLPAKLLAKNLEQSPAIGTNAEEDWGANGTRGLKTRERQEAGSAVTRSRKASRGSLNA
jgi:hypothetical protein